MTFKRKPLPRRTFLKGLGAAIALPMLDAMAPSWSFAAPTTQAAGAEAGAAAAAAAADGSAAAAAAAAGKSATRLAFVYVPNGIVMENWTPAAAGNAFEYTPILKPIEAYRDQTLIISGLMDNNGNALGDGAGDHARAGASYLTAAHPRKTGGSDIYVGVSADQVVAQAIGGQTRLPSLEIGLDDNRTVGHCDSGYSCVYTNSISWGTATSPLPPEASPRLLFERLFGDFDATLDDQTRLRRAKYRASILDMTGEETGRLENNLGSSDRRKIDEYLTTIRETEKRIQAAERDDRQQFVPTIDKPAGIPADFADHARLLYDLQVLAFQADLTRVVTMVVGREGSVRTYEQIGIPDPHHPLSHHRNVPASLAKLTKINAYHVELFSYFLDKLASTADGDGSLLDHSMILYGCGISDSNRHLHENLPVALIGGGNGQLSGGSHIRLTQDTPIANLFLSLMDRMGVVKERFGDSTGRLYI